MFLQFGGFPFFLFCVIFVYFQGFEGVWGCFSGCGSTLRRESTILNLTVIQLSHSGMEHHGTLGSAPAKTIGRLFISRRLLRAPKKNMETKECKIRLEEQILLHRSFPPGAFNYYYYMFLLSLFYFWVLVFFNVFFVFLSFFILFLDSSRFSASIASIFVEQNCFWMVFWPFYFFNTFFLNFIVFF